MCPIHVANLVESFQDILSKTTLQLVLEVNSPFDIFLIIRFKLI